MLALQSINYQNSCQNSSSRGVWFVSLTQDWITFLGNYLTTVHTNWYIPHISHQKLQHAVCKGPFTLCEKQCKGAKVGICEQNIVKSWASVKSGVSAHCKSESQTVDSEL